ncbi:hypothetical protein PDESU_03494 [Pontiella desulfatans]|uniref:Methyltransferase type 11 domain-containing protein n=1 Tax=Pontiella desulfatans TaxID=2750659 RepID=A0A6C2U676_PONDE|nr:methyltransferase domain-containing protein [Pontiella desulfatans]VGO14924.1 hypothetical protein PDESU_03494 [Pontiella desulfatans]
MDLIQHFRNMFPGVELEIDDLLLLEAFQIAYLPGWVPEQEFATVLQARPEIRRYLEMRCPSISGFLASASENHQNIHGKQQLEQAEERVVWTIADMLVYNKCPEAYDRLPFHQWDFAEITSIVDLTGKVVVDAGAGTGRVALEAAATAATVFAVEPVARLREFMRTKARQAGASNLFVVDGLLHALPFPAGFADVVITSHALGWNLESELEEFERVAKAGGTIIHCPGTADGNPEDEVHKTLLAAPWKYEFSTFEEPAPKSGGGRKRKYWKQA